MYLCTRKGRVKRARTRLQPSLAVPPRPSNVHEYSGKSLTLPVSYGRVLWDGRHPSAGGRKQKAP